MPELPTGTVTFLFTDLEGSTRLWEDHAVAMTDALARHDAILRGAATLWLRQSICRVAPRPCREDDRGRSLRRFRGGGRIGLHTAEAHLRDGDYYGPALNRAARLMAAAHGGQTVVSRATEVIVGQSLPEGTELLGLGEHRLRDLSHSEEIFQLVAPDLAREFPHLRTVDAYPGNLSPQLTSFVGREVELIEIAEQLDQSRLVTIVGVGGVGKTRLALHAAADVLPRYANGAWVCELTAAKNTDDVTQGVALALGVMQRAPMSVTESIVQFLRSKQLLIVLDNCEHVLDGAASLVESVLANCPKVRILATSRESLGVPGEQAWPLQSRRYE